MSSLAPAISFDTLVTMLRTRATVQPGDQAAAFLDDDRDEVGRLTYAGLDEKARAIAARLQSLGTQGDRVLLLYSPGLEFIAAFFGCLYAGMIAVPAYPPRPRTLDRLRRMVEDAQPVVFLTTSDLQALVAEMLTADPTFPARPWECTDVLDPAAEALKWREPAISRETLAFLQYTSGSTAIPRGVMVTHGNLLHNSEMIRVAFDNREGHSKGVSWLPLYHDMGLIGGILQPIYTGFPLTLMSPLTFLQRPYRWLEAISKTGATVSGAPNFAYDLCVRKVTAEQRAALDLSRWEVAFSGAEPVRADTIERFTAAFAECGFKRSAWYPCYGLAEATLFVTGSESGRGPRFFEASAAALEARQVARAGDGEQARTLVGCGRAWLDQQVLIADPDTLAPCAPGQIGEIWVSGPSVARGYWGREAESEGQFRAAASGHGSRTYLRTGDLGFLDEEDLFITGRIKDLIIIDGRNHYPQDIELTVEGSHPAVRENGSAAFSLEIGSEERLIVVAELEREHMPGRKGAAPLSEIAAAARRAVAEQHAVGLHELVLIKTGYLPKTTSGKVQRRATAQGYLDGTLNRVNGA